MIVGGSDTRAFEVPTLFASSVDGAGRTRFHVNVDPLLGDRFVQLYLVYEPDATVRRIAVARVTNGA